MRSHNARRIRPELEPLDRRDVPSGSAVGIVSPTGAQVAPTVTVTTTNYTGVLRPTPSYDGLTYQATAIVNQYSNGTFTAQVTVFEPMFHTVEYYGYGPDGPITGTIDSSGHFKGSGSGTDGSLSIEGQETMTGTGLTRLDFRWAVSVNGAPFSSGVGMFTSSTA